MRNYKQFGTVACGICLGIYFLIGGCLFGGLLLQAPRLPA